MPLHAYTRPRPCLPLYKKLYIDLSCGRVTPTLIYTPQLRDIPHRIYTSTARDDPTRSLVHGPAYPYTKKLYINLSCGRVTPTL